MTVFRMMAKAGEEALLELKKHGTQESFLGRMQTRQALYEVLGYEQYDLFAKRMKGGIE
jgi:methylisocitrate lyase